MFGFLGGAKFLTSKPFIGGMVGLILVTSLYLGYRHYTGLLNRVETLVATKSVLQTGIDIERAAVQQLLVTVDNWEESQDKLVATIAKLQENAHEAREENRNLRQLFAEIDLGAMPVAVADSVANGISDRLWDGISTASNSRGHSGGGSPPGDSDLTGAGADSSLTGEMAGN